MASIKMRPERSVLVGPGDDAGVYLLDNGTALVETVDLITPLVNDPFIFGSVSTANSLSDVYAMGGRPLTALAILGFSSCDYDSIVIGNILKGAIDVLDKAGVALMGGHSFEDNELKFGLSVTGTIDKERILRVTGAIPGDLLLLTKPIGTGIITTALKGGRIKDNEIEYAVKWMLTLNDRASEAALSAGANAATDITGFGLLGHASNMVKGSEVDFIIEYDEVPVLDNALDFVSGGIVSKGAFNNLKFVQDKVDFNPSLQEEARLLLSDPQTSGGLLVALPERNIEAFKSKGLKFWVIGRVVEGSGKLIVR